MSKQYLIYFMLYCCLSLPVFIPQPQNLKNKLLFRWCLIIYGCLVLNDNRTKHYVPWNWLIFKHRSPCSVELNMGTLSCMTLIKMTQNFLLYIGKHFTDNALYSSDNCSQVTRPLRTHTERKHPESNLGNKAGEWALLNLFNNQETSCPKRHKHNGRRVGAPLN
jgi:hypothetical protein